MSVLMIIYLVLLALLSVLIIRDMFKSNDVIRHFEAILVLIPFLMRLFLIK